MRIKKIVSILTVLCFLVSNVSFALDARINNMTQGGINLAANYATDDIVSGEHTLGIVDLMMYLRLIEKNRGQVPADLSTLREAFFEAADQQKARGTDDQITVEHDNGEIDLYPAQLELIAENTYRIPVSITKAGGTPDNFHLLFSTIPFEPVAKQIYPISTDTPAGQAFLANRSTAPAKGKPAQKPRSRGADGKFKNEPGKSPEDLLTVISIYFSEVDTFTAVGILGAYERCYKQLGFDPPSDNPESARRTINRDLYRRSRSLVDQKLLRILPGRGTYGEFLFKVTPKGRAHIRKLVGERNKITLTIIALSQTVQSTMDRLGGHFRIIAYRNGHEELRNMLPGLGLRALPTPRNMDTLSLQYLRALQTKGYLTIQNRTFTLTPSGGKEVSAIQLRYAKSMEKSVTASTITNLAEKAVSRENDLDGSVGAKKKVTANKETAIRDEIQNMQQEFAQLLAAVYDVAMLQQVLDSLRKSSSKAGKKNYYTYYIELVQIRVLNIPIGQSGLSVKARKVLGKLQIKTLGELITKGITREHLTQYNNIGPGIVAEIDSILVSVDKQRLPSLTMAHGESMPDTRPEDILNIIALYLPQGKNFKAQGVLKMYKQHYQELGLNAPPEDDESALLSIELNLHKQSDSLVEQGILEILPEKGKDDEDLYQLTTRGQASVDGLLHKHIRNALTVIALSEAIQAHFDEHNGISFRIIAYKRGHEELRERFPILGLHALQQPRNRDTLSTRHLKVLAARGYLYDLGDRAFKLTRKGKDEVARIQKKHDGKKPIRPVALISIAEKTASTEMTLNHRIKSDSKVTAKEEQKVRLKIQYANQKFVELLITTKDVSVLLDVLSRLKSSPGKANKEGYHAPYINLVKSRIEEIEPQPTQHTSKVGGHTKDGKSPEAAMVIIALAKLFKGSIATEFKLSRYKKAYEDVRKAYPALKLDSLTTNWQKTLRGDLRALVTRGILRIVNPDELGKPHRFKVANAAALHKISKLREEMGTLAWRYGHPSPEHELKDNILSLKTDLRYKIILVDKLGVGTITQLKELNWHDLRWTPGIGGYGADRIYHALYKTETSKTFGRYANSKSVASALHKLLDGTIRRDINSNHAYSPLEVVRYMMSLEKPVDEHASSRIYKEVSLALGVDLPKYQPATMLWQIYEKVLAKPEIQALIKRGLTAYAAFVVIDAMLAELEIGYKLGEGDVDKSYAPDNTAPVLNPMAQALLQQALDTLAKSHYEDDQRFYMNHASLKKALKEIGIVSAKGQFSRKSVLILTPRAAFGEHLDDGTYRPGLAILFRKPAAWGITTAVIAKTSEQKAFIAELNKGRPDDKKIIPVDSPEHARSSIGTAKTYYYLHVEGDETPPNGFISRNVTNIVDEIIRALETACSLTDENSWNKMKQAALLFAHAA